MTGIALGLGFIAGARFGWHALAAVAGLVAIRLLWPGGRGLLVPAGLLLLAVGLGGIRQCRKPMTGEITWATGTTAIVGRVISDPTVRRENQSFTLAVSGADRGGTWGPASGRVCALSPLAPPVGFGDRVEIHGQLTSAADASATTRAYLASRSCGASIYGTWVAVERTGTGYRHVLGDIRRRLNGVLFAAAPGDAGNLLAGLVTGDDGGLTPARRDAFLVTGTSHITAVSGANLALLITVLAEVGGIIGARRHVVWDVAIALVIAGYAGLVGFQPPVMRAGLVAILALVAARLGRKPDIATLLILVAAAMVAIDPRYLSSLSFKLSFASSLALVLSAPRGRPRGVTGWLGVSLLMTSVASLATLPFLPEPSRGLPLMAVFANLLIETAVTLAYPLAWLTAVVGLLSARCAMILAVPAQLLCQYIFAVVDHLQPTAEMMGPRGRAAWFGVGLSAVIAACLLGLGAEGQRFVDQGLTYVRMQRPYLLHAAIAAVVAIAVAAVWLVAIG